ncbi:hypothetical protein [Halomicrobium salinisoli]|uniref:hypothetical protein n=1 Tax=Halomicrobium salinisoli TaxID=2878391 RepID=UPI001CF0BD01|nr:hypothetical protein [Halomicrobium salinisoli]
MTEHTVTANKIASHLECPRKHEFEFERPLDASSASNSARERWSELLRQAIISGLEVNEGSPNERRDAAIEYLDANTDSTGESRIVHEEGEYQRSVAKEAIETYFTSDLGREHCENVRLIDTVLGYERNGIRYEVEVDAVVEAENGYQGLQFVPDVRLPPDWSEENVRQFRNGEKFYPRQIGRLLGAAIAIKGLMKEYGLETHNDFGYVSLVDRVRPNYDESGGIDVRAEARYLGDMYEEEQEEVNRLLEARTKAIIDGESDPRKWQYDAILEQSCRDCPYLDACPEYMAHDAAFVDRQRLSEDDQWSDAEFSGGDY